MKNKILIMLAGTTLALAGCGKNADGATADGSTDANLVLGDEFNTSTGDAPVPTTAQGFVNAAAASDRFEIESSKLAASAGSSKDVKQFASEMVTAHTASSAKLKSTIAGMTERLTPDDTLSPDQQQKLDALKGLKGAAFDSAYVSAQTQAHQMTLDMLKAYSASGDDADLKAFASGLVPTVTAHLNEAKSLGSAVSKDLRTNDQDTNLSNGM